MERLRCVIVENDVMSMEVLSTYCNASPFVEVTERFQDPRTFIKALPSLDFDVCIVGKGPNCTRRKQKE
jgi:hypothetical protein